MPTCPKCGYDLGGCRHDPHETIACPECGEAWSNAIEGGLKVWPGWGRSIRDILLVPGMAWGAILVAVLGGLMTPGALVFAYLLLPIPIVTGLFSPLVEAGACSMVPRLRRPHAGLVLLVGFALTFFLHVLVGVVTYTLYRAVR